MKELIITLKDMSDVAQVVYVVMGHHSHDKDFVAAIFSNERFAYSHCDDLQQHEENDYIYSVQMWSLRDV